MRTSFVLGIIGGIITFIVGLLVIMIGAIGQAFLGSSGGLEYLSILSFVAGIMGIVGGAMGKKIGGIVMIVGGVLALIGASIFGVLGTVLLIVGGVVALKEKQVTTMQPKQTS